MERVEAYVKLAGKGNAPELISAQQIEELRREIEGLVDRWCSDFRQDVESRAHGIGDRAVGLPGENEHNNLRRKLADVARKALREAALEGRTLQGRAAEAVVAADAPSRNIADASPYVLHPEIEKVSGNVFRDGHFREAAFNAYVAVIGEVKAKTHLLDKKGKPMDGEPLMRQAFDCENNKTPPVRFNDLKTESDRDEQQGFMHLFLGLVRLRHSKAHSVRPFDDASRAHEYLCLASLLMRLLDMATVGTAEAKEPVS